VQGSHAATLTTTGNLQNLREEPASTILMVLRWFFKLRNTSKIVLAETPKAR